MTLQQHELSAAFPAMPETDFEELAHSIRQHGVLNPITLYDGKVLDGWHRYRAAQIVGKACPQVTLDESIDPRDFVLAQNRTRRHVTQSALTLAATEVAKWVPHGGDRKSENIKTYPVRLDSENIKPYPVRFDSKSHKTAEEIAATVGASLSAVEQAKAVLRNAVQEVQAAVKSGEIGLRKAAAISRLDKSEQVAAIHQPMKKTSAIEHLRQEIHPDGGQTREEVEADISEEELEQARKEEAADIERMNLILSSDDALAALAEENKRLTNINLMLESRINSLLGEKSGAISFAKGETAKVKKLIRMVDALKAENAALKKRLDGSGDSVEEIEIC
jgi:ParB-like chromosome segregation protein Spo0J